MKREKVTFKNSKGLILSGALELPENDPPKAFAIFSHCFTCNKNLISVKYISEALSEKRIAVLRFDFAGLGDSQGNFAETDFSSNIDDLFHAAEFLTNNYEAPKLLVGHSLGGAASIVAAGQLTSVKAVSLVGTPSTLDHIKRLFVNKMDEIAYNVLILHSPEDELVSIDHATEIFMAARHPKSFIALDGIDHLIKNIKDARYVGNLIGEWAMRYL